MQHDDNIEQQNCILSNRSILRIAPKLSKYLLIHPNSYKPTYVDNNSQNTIRN